MSSEQAAIEFPSAVALDAAPSPRLASIQDEATTFWRLRTRTLSHMLRQALRQSRLRVSLVIGLSLFFWVGLFVLFFEGFHFLSSAINHSATHALTVQAIHNVFFVSLMTMLTLSSAIILYSGLYCSAEVMLLLTMPIRPERIALHKFQEAILFSSWGFFLLGSPMLVAYGLEAGAPWHYYLLLLPFMMAFTYIPAAIGAILCLLVVYWVPQVKLPAVVLPLAALAIVGILVGWTFVGGLDGNLLTPTRFRVMLDRLQFSEHRLLPSWWLSSGLLEAARRSDGDLDYYPWAESLRFLLVLISNALLCHVLLIWTAKRMYQPSYSQLHSKFTPRKSFKQFWLDRLMMRWTPFLPPPVRLLIVKDLRLFRRDPVQWSQFLIFFGLLALYFFNIRRFSYDTNYTAWVNMISSLNLAVVGLILSTFTTRFIFPMISLEGRRFWILGLLPVGRDAILWGKFLFAAVGSSLPCMLLIFLSDLMLRIAPLVTLIHQLICLLLCLGLSGIAVGLGARMPDLHEQSPSRIAAGFGGTLNLVLSAIYIVAVVLLTALPSHFFLAAEQAGVDQSGPRIWLTAGLLAAIALGAAATLIPMRIGIKAFRNLEF